MQNGTVTSLLVALCLFASRASGGQITEDLHHSLRGSHIPVLQWRTAGYIIRIDDLGYSRFRYAAWNADADQSEEPNLVLTFGVYEQDGSGGNGFYRFYNDIYTYECYDMWIGTGETPGYLRVYRNDDLILNEPVLEVIYSNR